MEFVVNLYRDSLQTPWGFRLEGGKDFKAPLSIQRVFVGAPASSDLLRGDIITSIHNEDASCLFHQEANELIRSSGGSLQLGIKRLPGYEQLQFQPFQSYKQSGNFNNNLAYSAFQMPSDDYDVTKHYRNSQIGVDNKQVPKPIMSQTGSSHLPTYQPFTVGECSSVQRFTVNRQPNTELNFTKPSYPKFSNTNHSPAPYVDRRMIGNIQQNLTRAVHAPANNFHQSSKSCAVLPKTNMKIGKYDVKTYSNTTPSFSKGPSVTGSNSASPVPSKIVTNKYNSPIGLYSNSTLKEEYNKQVGFQNSTSTSEF